MVLDNGSQRRFSTGVLFRPFAVALVIGTAGCGSSDSPTSPSNAVQVAGTWTYTLRLTGASGGECVGADLQNATPLNDGGTLEITQNGASLTATVQSNLVSGTCSYTGTASTDSFVLNLTRCDAGMVQSGLRMLERGGARSRIHQQPDQRYGVGNDRDWNLDRDL